MAWNVFQKKDEKGKGVQTKSTSVKTAAKESKKSVVAEVKPLATIAPAQDGNKHFSVPRRQLFIRPLITEKALILSGKNVYLFEVSDTATKINVKKAFYNLYHVMPLDVRIANVRGKVVRFGRVSGKRKDWKKAFIKVPAGTTVDIQ